MDCPHPPLTQSSLARWITRLATVGAYLLPTDFGRAEVAQAMQKEDLTMQPLELMADYHPGNAEGRADDAAPRADG